VGFGRACAPVRCAHPSFWTHCHAQRGALRPPPAHRSFAAPTKIKNRLYIETKSFPSSPKSAARGVYFSTGLSCTLLSYIAPYWTTLHPFELRCALLSYAAPFGSTLHPTKPCCIQLLLHPCELCCTLSELSCALRATLNPLSYASP
jgi:hypothetical protein